jgi:hypothetical protein
VSRWVVCCAALPLRAFKHTQGDASASSAYVHLPHYLASPAPLDPLTTTYHALTAAA